jgi:electron transfer flavoprotein beta subunit
MKILVPLKRVVDPYAKVRPLSDGSGIDTSSEKFAINPFDEIAVEEAVRLKETHGDVEIVVATIGGAECEEQLGKALAMGADRAVLLESDAEWDSPSVAKELEVLARELAPDLIIMGKQATDDDNNQVGQMLAARLDWPQATFASKVVVSGTTVTVTRETDTGEETLEMSTPALITTDLRLNEPRYVALPGIIKARSKPRDKRTAATQPSLKTKTVSVAAPPARAAGVKVSSIDELVSALKAKGVF